MIEVITNRQEWNAELDRIGAVDFYHTYSYHQLSKREEELPVLLKYNEGQSVIFLPLLLRNIENSEYKDATSVYGYCGILAQNIDPNFKKDNFYRALNTFLNKTKIIAVFTRLHPYIDEAEFMLQNLGQITSLGKVVYIDLSKTLEEQRASYNRRLKTYINKARKLCTVIEGTTEEHLDIFISLYHDNMRRIEATDDYFFDTDYYRQLLMNDDYEASLMMCKYNATGEIIAGAIFIKSGNIIQYHLSGLNHLYFDLQPIKLIIDEMRIKGTLQGYHYLNLGGGKGSEEDSLFEFKAKFSKDVKIFKIWKYIVNKDAYKALSESHLQTELKSEDLDKGFFPKYRAPLKSLS
ncbi:GNAT family N-acetyltransferase [Winogradskyella arenosi]|uniref:Acetyltransferase (GNAT) family protein n=1 Tax=Winogradskyella arenosi TaxID=533325 RepID=A0A368ZGI8_9FLAO|nr:GNAT family N-acetyltransferase [Winogradskyella arenosi]RCW92636.1 acetyltransferase (GNAT) family protein [Winogradskyella arenosi]